MRVFYSLLFLTAEVSGQFARPRPPLGPRLPQQQSGFNLDLFQTFMPLLTRLNTPGFPELVRVLSRWSNDLAFGPWKANR